ncbi:MAG TPA: hypothetical protein VGL47_11225, partial [Amycolatopsis sp.]|uniref:hypothetical protein n=1 Tax=Amycolatopsis sp. TaxID=37632 RepID=UPI002F41B77F
LKLTSLNGVAFDGTRDGVERLDRWFAQNIEEDSRDPGSLAPLWYSIVIDVGLLLGDLMIRQVPHLKWVFHTFGKTDINYHKAVIFGFTKIAVKNYTVDPDGLVATYGHRIVAGLDVDENLFNLILVSTRETA